MESRLRTYFAEEKKESLLFMALGLVMTMAGLACIFYMEGLQWKGAAFPLLVIAGIQLVVGATVYFRTDGQVSRLVEELQNNPSDFYDKEIDRMEVVNRNFKNYRTIEFLLFLLGFFFALMGSLGKWGAFTTGLGAGLALQSAIMMALDLFAEFRAGTYSHFLKKRA